MNQSTTGRPVAFLDTDVLTFFLEGKEPSSHLFDEDVVARVRYATNPIVLQDLLLLGTAQEYPKELETMRAQVKMLPVDLGTAEPLLRRARALRNGLVHSNDVLVLSSAADCDFLVTYRCAYDAVRLGDGPRVMTPEGFFVALQSR